MNKFRTATGGFDKRAIMLRAWSDFRAYRKDAPHITFATCLADAWRYAKREAVTPAIADLKTQILEIETLDRMVPSDFHRLQDLKTSLHAAQTQIAA